MIGRTDLSAKMIAPGQQRPPARPRNSAIRPMRSTVPTRARSLIRRRIRWPSSWDALREPGASTKSAAARWQTKP